MVFSPTTSLSPFGRSPFALSILDSFPIRIGSIRKSEIDSKKRPNLVEGWHFPSFHASARDRFHEAAVRTVHF